MTTLSYARAWTAFVRAGDPNRSTLANCRCCERDTRTAMTLDAVTTATGDPAGHWHRLYRVTAF
ncbi:hypothetical protein ACFQ78_33820 [Streptomyces sp. NPDC056519]|uniref:hypothetical protein n=1 Tax=Streptomyces sp. NPDC056519 TaxID=3345849 RepID=UPI0036BE4278